MSRYGLFLLRLLRVLFLKVSWGFGNGSIIFMWLILVDVFVAVRTGGTPLSGANRKARPEVTAISALQPDITVIQKQPQRQFGGFYRRATFKDILIWVWKRLLQSWHQFYLTVWGMTTKSISSKYLVTLGFELTVSSCFSLKSKVIVSDN